MKFGDKLRTLIEDRDITQKQLATDLNIAPSTIGGYVQNTSEPDFTTLKLLADYFNVSVDYLLNHCTGKANNHQEDELLQIFRAMSAEQKVVYIEQGKVVIRMNHKEKEIKSS